MYCIVLWCGVLLCHVVVCCVAFRCVALRCVVWNGKNGICGLSCTFDRNIIKVCVVKFISLNWQNLHTLMTVHGIDFCSRKPIWLSLRCDIREFVECICELYVHVWTWLSRCLYFTSGRCYLICNFDYKLTRFSNDECAYCYFCHWLRTCSAIDR